MRRGRLVGFRSGEAPLFGAGGENDDGQSLDGGNICCGLDDDDDVA